MKRIAHLKIDGKVFGSTFSPAEERLKSYLAAQPNDELTQVNMLARAGRFSSNTILLAKPNLIEMGLAHQHGARVYYGSKKAIQALKAILASQP